MSRARELERKEALSVTMGSRIVSIRWDVIPLSLVLDLDSPISEGEGTPMRRVWLIFEGVSDMTWPFDHARVPNGIWISSEIGIEEADQTFRRFSFPALLPRHRDDDSVVDSPTRTVTIRAQNISGVASREASSPGEFGGLAMIDRLALVADDELARAADRTL
jgi:hypothetical protein